MKKLLSPGRVIFIVVFLIALVAGAGARSFFDLVFFDRVQLNSLIYQNPAATHLITTKAPSSLATDFTFTLPPNAGTSGQFLRTDGSGTTTWVTASGSGSVTSFSFTNANGVTGVVTNPTTTPNLTITLGAITPTSVSASGAITSTGGDISTQSGQIISSADITLGTTSTFHWNGSTRLTAPVDGTMLITNQAGSGTPLIAFGAAGPSNAAVKGVGTEIQARIADDGAFAGFQAGQGRFNNQLTASTNSTVTLPAGNGIELLVVGANNQNIGIELQRYGGVATSDGALGFYAANGTAASPTALQAGDLIGCIEGGGFSASVRNNQASICMFTSVNNWTVSDASTQFQFFTTTRATTVPTRKATLTDTGNFDLETGVFSIAGVSLEKFTVTAQFSIAAGAGLSSGVANLCNTSVANCIDFVQRHNLARGPACTIQTGFGTGAAFVDGGCADESFRLNVGTTPGTSGTINFGHGYDNAPACFAQDETTSVLLRASANTGAVTINGVFVNNDIITVTCKSRT